MYGMRNDNSEIYRRTDSLLEHLYSFASQRYTCHRAVKNVLEFDEANVSAEFAAGRNALSNVAEEKLSGGAHST